MPERIQSHPEAVLWCRAVLQGWSWAQLQDAGLCRGQRDAETQLRLLTRELLQNEAEL
jgi:tRNA(Met) cytidine acetyltransferase